MAEQKGGRRKSKTENWNNPIAVAVSCSANHTFSKPSQPFIRLIEGIGVEGDAHSGKTVKHRPLSTRIPRRLICARYT